MLLVELYSTIYNTLSANFAQYNDSHSWNSKHKQIIIYSLPDLIGMAFFEHDFCTRKKYQIKTIKANPIKQQNDNN